MSPTSDGSACATSQGHCITCSDEGIEMIVVREGDGTTWCRDTVGVEHEIATELVSPVGSGERILVHAGVAIGRAA